MMSYSNEMYALYVFTNMCRWHDGIQWIFSPKIKGADLFIYTSNSDSFWTRNQIRQVVESTGVLNNIHQTYFLNIYSRTERHTDRHTGAPV